MFNREELQLISDAYIENVEGYLRDNDLKLDIDIPRELISLPILMVKYKAFEGETLAKTFLGDTYETIGENRFVQGKKEVENISNKKFIYRNHDVEAINYAIEEEEAIRLSNEFLKEKGLMDDSLKLQQIYFGIIKDFGETPVYKLVYNQTYKNRFLGESYVHVYVGHRDIVGVEAMLLEYNKTYDQKIKIIPATEALLRRMSDMLQDNKGEGEVIITQIELGYYFNPMDINFTNWDTVESGTAFPAWKIVLDNGKTYYVEALKN